MSYFVNNKLSSSSAFTHVYQCTSQSELENSIDIALRGQGYKKGESSKDLIYIKGNRWVRLMLGAFHKYYKFKIVIRPEGESHFSVLVSSASTGMSGGIIGVGQIKDETKKLYNLFQFI
ncbi:hypothetical protein [Apibacter adventoris]|uniref:Uncharacterized protein n=1 Tax=Apibacter adventoris TaxID=1679466 RepID=A0A2S8A6Y8_9FLAO|nr:hypothetical protein [Apibacter adventoris]PQL90331.1 hypothetical protein C4S77_10555 [Apibacter adventoris]